jgi:hypothetical protein
MARRPRLTPGTIRGSAETHLLITRRTGWDLGAYQDRLRTTVARLARIAEKDS